MYAWIPPEVGYCPGPRLGYPLNKGYSSRKGSVGGMPVAFLLEDCLVYVCVVVFFFVFFFAAFRGTITGPYPSANWTTAKQNCEALGQKMMTIDSPEENDYFILTFNPTFV